VSAGEPTPASAHGASRASTGGAPDGPDRPGPGDPPGAGARPAGRRGWIVALVVIAGALLLTALLGRGATRSLVMLGSWVQDHGALGPVVFVGVYAVSTVAFVPGSLLSLAAGALFGVVAGSVYVFLGATIGASAAFLIARYLARERVARRLAGDARLGAVDAAIEEEGRNVVFLRRLSPVFPFNLLNYALGLTRVRFVDYLVASVGMIPGIVLYVYSGRVAGDLALLAAGHELRHGPVQYALLGTGLVATVAVTVLVTRRARQALRGTVR
jgi:uncharacterized membrane protein YdjX (TVP38/TMEM64 family)